MNKEKLKDALIRMQNNLIAELEEKVMTTHTMVDLDEGDTIDPEDFSHQYESGEMEQLMLLQLNKARRNLEVLKSIDFGSKSKAASGALVVTDKMALLIGFPVIPFDFEGKHIVGISKDSPMYACLIDKLPGDVISYCGEHYLIEKIY